MHIWTSSVKRIIFLLYHKYKNPEYMRTLQVLIERGIRDEICSKKNRDLNKRKSSSSINNTSTSCLNMVYVILAALPSNSIYNSWRWYLPSIYTAIVSHKYLLHIQSLVIFIVLSFQHIFPVVCLLQTSYPVLLVFHQFQIPRLVCLPIPPNKLYCGSYNE